MTEKSESLLTYQEAAALLGIHPETIKRWVREGRIPALRIARTVRIRKAALLSLERAEGRP